MSLPVVLPGSCCRLTGASFAPHFSDSFYRSRDRRMPAAPSRTPGSQSGLIPEWPPGRPLLSLGLLQLVLGCAMVALSFGALSLSSSPPIRNSCPFWAGSSVILSGIIGLTTWKRPMLLLVNLFVLLSVVCILLNLAAFILCCQGAQLVSNSNFCQLVRSERGDICNCCAESPSSQCQDEKLLRIYAGHSCETMRILLKKVLFALCALNALTTAVCLIAAALRYLQIFSARRPCMVEVQNVPEEREEQQRFSDPEEFVPPAPPPSYFSTIYSCTPRLARRMFGDSVIPLPHIYGARIKGVEVFCPLDPPPPYEAVAAVETPPLLVSRRGVPMAAKVSRKARRPRTRRSNSDPVLLDLAAKVMRCEAATQTEMGAGPAAVTMRRGRGPRRPRPSSMVDYQSYRDTKLLVAQFLQQSSSCSLTREVRELIDSITSVLRSDEEHMEEVGGSSRATQTRQPRWDCTSNTVPLRKQPGLLHLWSCGDLSTFTLAELHLASKEARSGSRPGARRLPHERPHSLMGVSQETVI
uniref:Family with sequence similarity 189 member A2 n=1 Tax=Electrophorus electricus TaxID=8005 RepID=A0A4W4FSH0_ELEEL